MQGRSREQAPSSCAPVARLATALSPGCSAELCCHRCQRQPARHATRRGNAPAQIAGSCLLAEIRSYRAGPSGRAISGKPCAVALQVAGCVLDVARCMWHVAWHVCSHRPRMARNELRETECICIPNTHCEVVRAAHHLPGAQPERAPMPDPRSPSSGSLQHHRVCAAALKAVVQCLPLGAACAGAGPHLAETGPQLGWDWPDPLCAQVHRSRPNVAEAAPASAVQALPAKQVAERGAMCDRTRGGTGTALESQSPAPPHPLARRCRCWRLGACRRCRAQS